MQTLYDVLGVPITATPAEVHDAHRKLLLRVHPDRCYHDNDSAIFNPREELDAARLAVLETAHEVLSDPEKRHRYDKYLVQKLRSGAARCPPLVPSSQWHASSAGTGDDVLRCMMELLSVSLGSPVVLSTVVPAQKLAMQQQQQHQRPSAFAMTNILRRPVAQSSENAGGPPTVYAAAISVQRLPDATISVHTYESSSVPGAAAVVALPRRVRLMEEQLTPKESATTTSSSSSSSSGARADSATSPVAATTEK